MEIKRDVYLERLVRRKQNGLIKVITGIRRCGKSYLMNVIFYNYLLNSGVKKDHIIKFAFDNEEDLSLIGIDFLEVNKSNKVDPRKFLNYIKSKINNNGEYYLLLDEVQNLGSFEAVLNGFLYKQNIDVYVTGSNSKFLSSDVITEFRGRGDEIKVFPLSFSEYYEAKNNKTKEGAYNDYSIYGGLPAISLMEGEEQKGSYLKSQMQNVYLRDIIDRHNLKGNEIEELINVLASDISSLLSPGKLSNTFKSKRSSSTLSATTIDNYINYLSDAFVLSKVQRYDIKGKRYISSPYKIYFEDVGLRNARLNFRQIEQTHIMENVIYNELRYRGFDVDVGNIEIREKKKGKEIKKQNEVDFIANSGSRRYYIQSAYSIPDKEKMEQEQKPLLHIKDSFKKIIVVRDNTPLWRNEEGVVIMNIYDFLLNQNSLDI